MSGDIEDRLDEIRESGLYRRMRCVSGPQGPRVLLDGKPVLLHEEVGLTAERVTERVLGALARRDALHRA